MQTWTMWGVTFEGYWRWVISYLLPLTITNFLILPLTLLTLHLNPHLLLTHPHPNPPHFHPNPNHLHYPNHLLSLNFINRLLPLLQSWRLTLLRLTFVSLGIEILFKEFVIIWINYFCIALYWFYRFFLKVIYLIHQGRTRLLVLCIFLFLNTTF